MNKDKGLVVILSHADTLDKKEILMECISTIKKQGYDVLVSSHIEVPMDINDMVDYVIYDKDNPLIMYDEYLNNPSVVYVWMTLPGYEQNYPIRFNHAYAVLKLIQNGLAIAEISNYEKVHFIDYDYVINDEKVLIRHNELLDTNDIISYNWLDYGSSHTNNISSSLFSVNSKFFNLIKNIKSKEDYCKYGSPVFEEFLYDYVTNNSTLRIFSIPVAEILDNLPPDEVGKATTNKIATKSILDNYIIEGKVYLFLTKDAYGQYYILIRYDNKTLNANFKIGDKEYNFTTSKGITLLPISMEQLEQDVYINIETNNDDNISVDRKFTSKTVPADCKISDNSYIFNLFGKKNFNDVVIIVSHADTNEKVDVLKQCIDVVKDQGYDVILTSHIPVPDHIMDSIDFLVYDKKNPVIDTGENSTTFWLAFDGYSQQYKFRINYSYSILRLIKNAISLSNINGFEISHIINYDYIILDKLLLNNHCDILKEKDVIFYQQDGIDGTICPGVYSFKNDKVIELFKDINSSDKYFSYGITQFENFLYHNFTKLNYQQESMSKLAEKNLLDLINLNSKFSVENEVDGHVEKTLIFISKENDDYYIFINTNIEIEVEISIDNIYFKPKINSVNLIKIDYTDILNGFSINIPTINFYNTYDINTNIADCRVTNHELVIDKKQI